MSNGQRVLVVDGLSETQEVLRTVFEPRGLQVDRIRSESCAALETYCDQPDVVVIDAEHLPIAGSSGTMWDGVPQVIIGSAQVHDAGLLDRGTDSCYLEKPFQYPELIRAIEQLLPS